MFLEADLDLCQTDGMTSFRLLSLAFLLAVCA